jgi:hypothetical protein
MGNRTTGGVIEDANCNVTIALDEPSTTPLIDVNGRRSGSSTEASDNAPLNPTPPMAHIPPLTPRPHGDPSVALTSMEDLQGRVRKLEAKNKLLHMHATMAYKEVDQLQHRINMKKSKKKGKERVSIASSEGRWWTVRKGRELAMAKDAEDEAKVKKKREAIAEKCAKADKRQRQRASLTALFSGSLSSKMKEGLKDITWALSLAIDPKAKKDDLQDLILTGFQNSWKMLVSVVSMLSTPE